MASHHVCDRFDNVGVDRDLEAKHMFRILHGERR